MTAPSDVTRSGRRASFRGVRYRAPQGPHFLLDLGMCLANLAFYPLSYFALIPEVRRDLLGLGEGLLIDGPLYSALFVSAFATLASARGRNHGPLARAGIFFNLIVFCLLLPIVFGFAWMTFVTFALGGPEVLLILWEGILYFGFLAFCFLGDHHPENTCETGTSTGCSKNAASEMRSRSCEAECGVRERGYFPFSPTAITLPIRRRTWYAFWNGWHGRWY